MSEIVQRAIQQKRVVIGGGAWVRREGDSITIDYDYAGRFTTETQYFNVAEIHALAQFVAETNAPPVTDAGPIQPMEYAKPSLWDRLKLGRWG